jgi:hypothetical protein
VFDRCYDAGPYHRINLRREVVPDPPLTAEQAEWCEQLLEEKGFLPKKTS